MAFPLRDLLLLKQTPGLGPNRVRQLVEAFQSPENIYKAAAPELARLEGFDKVLSQKVISSINDAVNDIKFNRAIERQLQKIEQFGARAITFQDDAYPKNLDNVYDKPVLLFVKGELEERDDFSVAIVGSRSVSEYGILSAEKIAGELAEKGITVVSGLASGIDTHAHRGCLKANGRTVAVLGNGLDYVYPPANKDLYESIPENGALVSEFLFGAKPLKDNFPMRNRIISGMSLGTVVIEASKKSGSLITARFALEQNREVFAVPGNISSGKSEGTNKLIRDSAAKLVLSADDIIDELAAKLAPVLQHHETSVKDISFLNEEEKLIYERMGDESVHVDFISRETRLPVSTILSKFLSLELHGLVRKLPGNKYIKV